MLSGLLMCSIGCPLLSWALHGQGAHMYSIKCPALHGQGAHMYSIGCPALHGRCTAACLA